MSIFEEPKKRDKVSYKWAQKYSHAIQDGAWTDRLFSFRGDVHNFKVDATQHERDVIKRTLSAISHIECQVKLKWQKIGETLPYEQIMNMSTVISANEVAHLEAYQRLLEILEIEEDFENNMKTEVIEKRAKYLKKHIHKYYENARKQFVYSLILFTLFVENVSLFSQFYIINWFGRYKNMFKDANQQVNYTRLEETIHAMAGSEIINTIREEHPELFDEEMHEKIRQETLEALEAESQIIDWILEGYEGERLSATVLKEYVKNRLNESLEMIKLPKMFTIDPMLKRDFEWMYEETVGEGSTDFFHSRPVEYAKNNKSFDEEDLF